jgi:hypothetical protein
VLRSSVFAFVLLSFVANSLWAAQPSDAPPLQCWWRTDRAAVHVGEQLVLTLSCAVTANGTTTVLPDWEQLQPEVIDLAPYEVVAGSRSEDVVIGASRYTQFEYTLRLTGEEFFGQDVPLPSLDVVYSLAVTQSGSNVQQGRERTYVLPPLPMKIISLVPGVASDIEDVPGYSFASIEQRRHRASLAFVIACGLLAAATLCAVMFVTTLLSRARTRRIAEPFRVADWRIVLGCRSGLQSLVADARRNGWTDARVGEALALVRVLGAIAVGRLARQRILGRGQSAEVGEWVLHRWSLRRPRVAIAAAMTAYQMTAYAANAPRALSSDRFDAIATAIAACSDLRYARSDVEAGVVAVLDQAMADALRASRGLLFTVLLPSRVRLPGLQHPASSPA